MSEQRSPFELYGKMLTAYVNACVEVNRAWFDGAARLGAGFFTPFSVLRVTQPNRSAAAPAAAAISAAVSTAETFAATALAETSSATHVPETSAATAEFAPPFLAPVAEAPAGDAVPIEPAAASAFEPAAAVAVQPAAVVEAERSESLESHVSAAEAPRHVAVIAPSDVAEQSKLMAELGPTGDGPALGDLVADDDAAKPSSGSGPAAVLAASIDPDILSAVHDVLQPHSEGAASSSDAPPAPATANASPKRSRKPKAR